MSYSPKTRLVYMPVADMPSTYSASGFFGARVEVLGYGPEEEVPLGAGRLVAWDPVQRAVRWTVDYPIPHNGGVLSTAGNLIFQGTAAGEFHAYHAVTGDRLWSSGKLGTTVQAAPVSYRLGDEQYVLATAGRGGALGMVTSLRTQAPDARGPARLFAFKLGGKAEMPSSTVKPTPVPRPPPRARRASSRSGEEVSFLGIRVAISATADTPSAATSETPQTAPCPIFATCRPSYTRSGTASWWVGAVAWVACPASDRI